MKHKKKKPKILFQSKCCSLIQEEQTANLNWIKVLDMDHRVIGQFELPKPQDLQEIISELIRICAEKDDRLIAFFLKKLLPEEIEDVREAADFGCLYLIFGEERVYRIGNTAVITFV
ncbi:MAG: hypothetical protein ACLSX0_01505 [Anaerostipes caccae]|jgi:hypothetical protein